MTKPRKTEPELDAAELCDAVLDRGAEPYWMQDCRIAQRKIAEEMTRIRANQRAGRSTDQP